MRCTGRNTLVTGSNGGIGYAIAAQIEKSASTREASIEALLQTRQPSRRMITREQVAAFAVFLCTEAASSITGSALSIDGGWSAAP